MSVFKLFILSLMMVGLSFCGSKHMESAATNVKFESGSRFANKEDPYRFTVAKDGQMVRLEFKGTAPMNKWQSFDMEVFTADENYLFSYQDELWSESGYDSDGAWTERKRHAYFDIRFPKKGEYLVYLTDSTNNRSGSMKYTFRAVPINGNANAFKPLMYFFGVIALICFIIIGNIFEEESNKPMRPSFEPPKKKSNSWIYFFAGALLLWFIVFLIASDDDDDIDINTYYIGYSHKSNSIYVDRSLRQQSLSGSNFRSGSGKGGK